jgi:uncharacterized protein (UPF0548 family)
MFLARRPSPAEIQRFLIASQDLRLSYGPPGILDDPPAGFQLDEETFVIGHGQHDFDRARAALMSWTQFDLGWVEIFPHQAAIAEGTVAAVLIKHFGFWSLNGCRVLSTDSTLPDRFGFVYGTLTNHAESGEERFEVLLHPHGEVVYRIHAVSRPRAMLARLGKPLVRMLQARFRRDSAETIARCFNG